MSEEQKSQCVCLTLEEVEWVRMAIKREIRKEKMFEAILEQTIPALLWSAIAAAAGWAYHYISSHWK